jgi:hypothetical protein
MPLNALIQESHKLHNVSDRLESIADENANISEPLLVIAGNVRQTATLLEVFIATKVSPLSDPGTAND